MIGVGTDYLNHLNTKSSTFNVKASIKKNAKESIVPGLGFLKKIKKAYKLADEIKDAQKKAKGYERKTSLSFGQSIEAVYGSKKVKLRCRYRARIALFIRTGINEGLSNVIFLK